MSKKLTQAEVLRRFREAHGNRYDYSEMNFAKTSEKVRIRCKIHELIFEQLIHTHVNGSGCPHCEIRHSARQLFYEYEGVRFPSLKALCASYDLDEAVTQKRLQNGWSLQDTILKPHVPAARTWEHEGVFYRSFGVLFDAVKPPCSYNTFRRRLNAGLTIEDASTQLPSHGHSNGLVYLITNKVNGLKYVGITTETAKIRFARHVAGATAKKHKNQNSLARAILEFGKEGFSVKTLRHAGNILELGKLEKYYIAKYGCLAPNGYNLSAGGSIGKPTGKITTIDSVKFLSLKKAAEYLSIQKSISYSAAEKRISEGRIHVEILGKKVKVHALGRTFESKAALARYMYKQGFSPSIGAAIHRIFRGQIDLKEVEAWDR